MSDFRKRLVQVVGPYVPLSQTQLHALEAHYELLVKWNRKLNLTAIRTLEEAVTRHYAECLYFGRALGGLTREQLGIETPSIADIGSGAGFPGIPVAILHPKWSVTLIESHQRKSVFLSEACLNLPNVVVRPERAQLVPMSFDIAVSRAVRPTEVLSYHLAPATCLLASEDDVPRGTIVDRLPWGSHRVISFHVEHRPPVR
jgi:16S rRNA (guanine(527)-N(7))-methyltransferase RsmG